MMIFRFSTELRCHLRNGHKTLLRGFIVPVQADSPDQAEQCVRSIATEMVHERGSQLIDCPMDYLDVVSSRPLR